MKHLKLYEEFTSNPDHPGFFKTYEETENWLDEMGIEKYYIEDGLVVDVYWNVDISDKNLKYIPVQFGATRKFHCQNNQLTSLKGCPSKVLITFDCSHNQLTSLTGGPSEVGGHFNCSNNQLNNLTGSPSKLGWGFDCSNNHLTSLTGFLRKIRGEFYNYNNYLTIDEPYRIEKDNPGYKLRKFIKIAQNFIDKLETSKLDPTTQLRILDSLKDDKPKIYSELGKLVDLDDWLSRLQNSETHKDILDL